MKKKNSAKRRLLSAAGMLAVSAAMLSSATFAWFTMNKNVEVQNMKLTATAEQGIVIAAYTDNNATAPAASAFADTAPVDVTGVNGEAVATLIPTYTSGKADSAESGKDASGMLWYHAASTKSNDARAYAEAGYQKVTNGMSDGNSGNNYYYLLNKFQIKSPGGAQAVYVKSVTVTRTDSNEAIDPSIRVMIKTDDTNTPLFFAPIGTHTAVEGISATTAESDAVTANESISFATQANVSSKIFEDVAAQAENVEVYVYYDGEDDACKSDNITDFQTLDVDIVFTTDSTFAS